MIEATAFRDRIVGLERVPASQLRPNPLNWRTHPDKQRAAWREISATLGFAGAVLARRLDDCTLEIIDGHLRAEESGDEPVPVLVTDLNEDEAKTVLATFDPISALAGTEKGALDGLLSSMAGSDETLRQLVNSVGSMAGLIPPAPFEQDEVPEVPTDPVTKQGDLWLLGEHRLLCGDSTNADMVARLLDVNKPFMMVTDPPYGVEYDPEWREKALWKTNRRTGVVANDTQVEWCDAWRLFGGDVFYCWHSGKYAGASCNDITSAGFDVRCQIIWAKQQLALSRGHYHWMHEPCWYAVRRGSKARWCGDRKQTTIWNIQTAIEYVKNKGEGEDAGDIHSTQKPVECMARPIRNHGAPGDYIYDPFVGSGTTVIACEQLDRRCLAMELMPNYCDVVVARYEKFTGKKAERVAA